jgi:GT2 family glycosyltransferase
LKDFKLIHSHWALSLKDETIGLISPLIINSTNSIEDSFRFFPSFSSLIKKLFFKYEGRFNFDNSKVIFYPDWVAGMFMLFPSSVFSTLNGFDENFFLYYEDVDICKRLSFHSKKIAVCSKVKAIHHAQRASRKNILYFRFHLFSLFRYFLKKYY